MRTFRVNVIINKEDYDYFKTQSDCELTANFWSSITFDDYTQMELIDVDRQQVLQDGDTIHDDIYSCINNFLEGVSYIIGENSNYCVEYGFKTPEEEKVVASTVFEKGELYNECF